MNSYNNYPLIMHIDIFIGMFQYFCDLFFIYSPSPISLRRTIVINNNKNNNNHIQDHSDEHHANVDIDNNPSVRPIRVKIPRSFRRGQSNTRAGDVVTMYERLMFKNNIHDGGDSNDGNGNVDSSRRRNEGSSDNGDFGDIGDSDSEDIGSVDGDSGNVKRRKLIIDRTRSDMIHNELLMKMKTMKKLQAKVGV